MRYQTIAAVTLIFLAAIGLFVVGFWTGPSDSTAMSVLWTSDTAREIGGNHHAPAAGRIDGTPLVYAPISGRADTTNCALVALNGSTGEQRWSHRISPENCTIHSVADPTLADFDGDGLREVIAATTEQTVTAFHPFNGTVEFRSELTSYGYTQPVVADLTGDSDLELIVVDVRGTVFVFATNGSVVWSTQLSAYTWGQPAVADFDGDGESELAVATGTTGNLYLFEQDGSIAWSASPVPEGGITWMTTGQLDGDAPVEIAVASTSNGYVSVVDGAAGEREWLRSLGSFAAVHAIGDGDGDDTTEIYAVANDGILRSLDGRTGETEWSTTLTTADVQMMPPPALGDLDGDGDPELLAVTNDGFVKVVDPASGTVLDTYQRDGKIYTHPELADIDSDGALEAFVIYGDGRVIAFEFD